MNDSEQKVCCETHGSGTATFLCKHLLEGEKRGFHVGYDPKQPYALYPDAWCDECDTVLDKEGEWNEVSENFADVKMVCSDCYQEIRERNWIQDEEAWSALVQDGFSYLKERQQHFLDEFQIMSYDRWDWDQDTGMLTFSHEGKPRVVAEISFSGTLSKSAGTWMWAWANDSLADKIKSESLVMRHAGEREHHLKLASALWKADEVDGWEMTAIMAKALGATGAYRTSSESGFTYMIVKQVSRLTP